MKKFLIFPDLETSPVLTGTDNCSCFEPIWQSGHSIDPNDNDMSRLEFVVESTGVDSLPDFMATDLGAPIFSSRLKNYCDQLRIDNCIYYPCSVVHDGTKYTDFYAVNILGLVNCIDFDSSDLECEEEDGEIVDIDEVNTMVLNSSSYGYIYRLWMFERVIVAEEYLAKHFIDKNISGLKIVEPEQWDGLAGEK